jgi:cysteine desulfurase
LAASTGSACHAGTATISPVLEAMGTPMDRAIGAIRLSLGRTSTASEVDDVVEELQSVIGATASVRRSAGNRRQTVNH